MHSLSQRTDGSELLFINMISGAHDILLHTSPNQYLCASDAQIADITLNFRGLLKLIVYVFLRSNADTLAIRPAETLVKQTSDQSVWS